MKNSTRLLMLAIGFILSSSILAATQNETTESPDMPLMKQGDNMMMNPQMMQMRMQHMQKMEQHLAKIESLLAQILEAQKSK